MLLSNGREVNDKNKSPAPLIVKDLKVYYPVRRGLFGKLQHVKALDGVSFEIAKGETFGVVGESGCGKSTLALAIAKLVKLTSGQIILDGEDISHYSASQMQPVRKKIQMIFQDPYASLNPRMTVRDIVAEPLIIHNVCKSSKEVDEKVIELLRQVGLDDYHANRYAHQFSGGQRQRIGIARSLALDPILVIADEPVSALDVSIQSQVLNLLSELNKHMHLTYLFIAHDLSVVEHISDRVGVMYLGEFVEVSDRDDLYNRPLHPYTQALLSAIPSIDPEEKKERIILEGNIPSPINAPSGCKFHPRCRHCMPICKELSPKKSVITDKHYVYCHLYTEKDKKE